MSWRHDPITDLDLMAYADGQLDAARRQTVEAHLDAHPDDAAMVEAIMEQNAALRARLAAIAEEPVPERLKAVLEREPRSQLQPLLKVASIVTLVATSGLGGWWLGQQAGGPVGAPPAFLEALAPVLAVDELAVFDATAAVQARAEETVEMPLPWLGEPVTLQLRAPGLGAGFTSPELQQLVDIDGRPTVRFILDGPEGRRLSLYLQTRGPAAPAAIRLVEADATAATGPAAYWQDGPLVWALTGDAEGAELAALARTIASAIELEPHLGPIEVELTDGQGGIQPVRLSADELPGLAWPALPPLQLLPIELAGG